MYENQFYKALGKYSEYCISNVPWYDPEPPRSPSAVEAAFKKQFPKDQLMFHALNVGYTFEAMMVVADAFKRAGSTDAKALAEAIRRPTSTSRMMLGGPIKFDAKGQIKAIASACIQNLNMQADGRAAAGMRREAKPVFRCPAAKARG